jgi:hypothetical protein
VVQALKSWDAAVDTTSAEIRICVANKADLINSSGAPRAAWLAGAMEWCLEVKILLHGAGDW